jgi:hypothetical protein
VPNLSMTLSQIGAQRVSESIVGFEWHWLEELYKMLYNLSPIR